MLERPSALSPIEALDRIEAHTFPIVDRWATHPGDGLTTKKIVDIYRQAEAGYPAYQCDMFEDLIERDTHLRSQIEARIEAVAAANWIVQAGGDQAADQAAAAALSLALAEVPNFADAIYHQMTAPFYGWAASEIIWERVGNVTIPVWFVNVPHRRFVTPYLPGVAGQLGSGNDDDLRLVTGTSDLVTGEALTPGKWWVSRGHGRQLARTGAMRTAAWWSLFKHMAVRDWMVFTSRFGLPYVSGKFKQTASDEDRKVLAEAVMRFGRDGASIYSEACDITIHEVAKGGRSDDIHGAIMAAFNAEISKLISGATLTAETGGPGSFALGKVHAGRSFGRTLNDAAYLGRLFQSEIGKPFVFYNGMKAAAPRLHLQVTPEVDPFQRMKLFSMAINDCGLEVDGEQMRQEFQIKKPGPGGEVLKRVEPPPPGSVPYRAEGNQ